MKNKTDNKFSTYKVKDISLADWGRKEINLAFLRGFMSLYLSLRAIKPGISASARLISFLPQSASEISFTL